MFRENKAGEEIMIGLLAIRRTWCALCDWGGNDKDEGEDEGRKATVDHDPARGWAPEEKQTI